MIPILAKKFGNTRGGVRTSVTLGCIHQSRIVFNENGIIGKAGIDIVYCIFGIGLCDNNNEYEICNGMYDIFVVLYLCTKQKTNVFCFLFRYLFDG